jgi:hypothetical protein
VPAELHVNRMQWVDKTLRYTLFVSVMWRPGLHRSLWLRCQVCTHFWCLVRQIHVRITESAAIHYGAWTKVIFHCGCTNEC